ncbi:hypothetical protein P3T73_16615 [Kiritimatiellota bacterium B12222]|nr:hypothetical protein P3T73_16615 [Kiritimatiellota bacterium B12222]
MNSHEELQAWQQWRDACALALISEDASAQLTRVIALRFKSMLRKVNLHGNKGLAAPSDRECAALFESYCALHQRRDGKKYKQWLLTRGRRDLDTVQSGVMLLVRNVVREWIRDAHPQTAEVSLQKSVGLTGKSVPLEQLLPDCSSQSRSEEQQAWVLERIQKQTEFLKPAEQVALFLRAQGTVFSAPGVKQRFGFGKTLLHQRLRQLMERLVEEVKDHFPGVAGEEGVGMVLDVLDGWGQYFLCEISAENTRFSAFGEVEVHDDTE